MIKVQVEITEDIDRIYECLITEASERDRTSLEIKKTGKKLKLIAKAKDATALRATLNSISQLLLVYDKMRNI